MDDVSDDTLEELTPKLAAKFTELSKSAQSGDVAARREMIQASRDYLLFIANQELSSELRPKYAASDIVQDTMLRAVEGYDKFRGETRRSLLAWLRQILLHEIVDVRRRYIDAEKRSIRRETCLNDDSSSSLLRPVLAADDKTPSSDAAAREEAIRLRDALAKLSDDYQEVLRLRNWERLPFAAIAEKMQRSESAVKKLWGRAVEALKLKFGD